MSFNSPGFILFIFVVVAINYFLKQTWRIPFFLFCSLLFIGSFNLDSLVAVLFLTAINFHFAKRISENRLAYNAGILVNVFAIIIFNYFITSQEGIHFYFSGISFNIESFIVAVGVSFYSLQNIAYLTEIYFKRLVPEKSFLNYLLYISFFPKIISGPIMMPKEFLPQLKPYAVSKENLTEGFNRFLLGLFKKMVIADRLFPMVESIFDYDDNYPGFTTIIGIYAFTIQLYFDFSGYTDMAIGISKMLGIDLKENFQTPLRSTSISQFWRRWHISLISWLSNTIYYPVVYRFRKYKKGAALLGILLTFLISGIWHGIGFTFLAWAGCHAIYLGFELLSKSTRSKMARRFNGNLYKLFSAFIVFNAVCFSNIFFRAGSIEKAVQLIKNSGSHFLPENWLSDFIAPLAIGGHQIEQFNLFITLLIPLLVLLYENKINHFGKNQKFNMVFVSICVLTILVFGVFNSGSRFIYMQF